MNLNEKVAKPPPPKVTSIEPSALVVAPETKTASPTRRYSDTPLILSSPLSRSSARYDVTNTMHRLRSSFTGDMSNQKWLSSYGSLLTNTSSNTLESIELLSNDDDDDDDIIAPIVKRSSLTSPMNNNDMEQQQNYHDNNNNEIKKSQQKRTHHHQHHQHKQQHKHNIKTWIYDILYQIPAIILIAMFHLMVGIPFGVSYFPIGWRSRSSSTINTNNNSNINNRNHTDARNRRRRIKTITNPSSYQQFSHHHVLNLNHNISDNNIIDDNDILNVTKILLSPYGINDFSFHDDNYQNILPIEQNYRYLLDTSNNDNTTTATGSSTTSTSTTIIDGIFPINGKEAFGIRMFLFSTIIGQLVYTYTSGFNNPIGLQMVENVPFCHELSIIAISYQGYTIETLSTILVMFSISSIVVGIVFYLLGKYQLGRIVYYFPKHVLVGCIGGIGIFIAKTGIEVTMNNIFSIYNILYHYNHLLFVLLFEIILRILEKITKDPITHNAKYPLLAPIYFCSITPIFYIILYVCNISLNDAMNHGYFFPHLVDNISSSSETTVTTGMIQQQDWNTSSYSSSSTDDNIVIASSFWNTIFNKDLFDLWTVINLSTVSIPALIHAIPTMIALVLFSLIHVPINIPAFAISSNHSDIDMNNELISHGYSNLIAGMFGGLQNYMAYTQSVLYHKSGGKGKVSGTVVAIVTLFLYIIGPTIASYIPRCMAGCLLLHVGIDLFLEGVYDSYGQFDQLEYFGIWLITIVMTLYGMEASMIAGFIAAISTYVVQNTTYVNPIRGSMSATTLRSSHFQRQYDSLIILSHPIYGRSRIFVIQLQGHLFFGNMAHFSELICTIIKSKFNYNTNNNLMNNVNNYISSSSTSTLLPQPPYIVIFDFSLVLGIDSSAAHAISKIRYTLKKKLNIDLCIFVTGSSNGFPTEYNLTKELSSSSNINNSIPSTTTTTSVDTPKLDDDNHHHNPIIPVSYLSSTQNEMTGLLNPPKVPVLDQYTGSHVFFTLDEGLVFAENALIARHDPSILYDDSNTSGLLGSTNENILSLDDEKSIVIQNLIRLAPSGTDISIINELYNSFVRETYKLDDIIWKQGSNSNCAKLLIRGQLMAILEDEAGTYEKIAHGNMLGELGLVENISRMSTVIVLSEEAVLYSINRDTYEQHISSQAARLIDYVCIKYLSARVQHVSNRIFETRCLPV